MGEARTSGELGNYGALLWRRKFSIIFCTLLGLVAGLAYASTATKSYTSTASVLVKPLGAQDTQSTSNSRTGNANLDTEAQLVRSQAVASAAQKLLKTKVPVSQLTKIVTVTVPPNTSVLNISCAASDAPSAQHCADAFARAYLQVRQDGATADQKAQQADLSKQVSALRTELQVLSGRTAVLPANSTDRALNQAQQSIVVNQLSSLQSRLAQLSAGSTDPGTIIKGASLPAAPTWPVLPLVVGVGLVLGLLVGLAVALLRARLDRRIWRAEQIEDELALPVLTEVSQRPGRGAVATAGGPDATSYQMLGNIVLSARRRPQLRVVVVAGAGTTSATGVANNLAATLSRSGDDVLLLSAEAVDATQPFGVAAEPGLSDVIEHGARLADVLQRADELPNLQIVAPGAAGVTVEQLHSRRLAELVAMARESVRLVVIDAPPLATGAAAQALASVADAAILVVESRRTTTQDVDEARRRFELVGTPVLGVVMLGKARRGAAGQQQPRRLAPPIAAGSALDVPAQG